MAQEFNKKFTGTEKKPRVSVFRSNKEIYAQVINDQSGKTLVSASTKEIKEGKTPIEKALFCGKLLAKKAREAKISEVVYDRNGYRYHGRVKSLAEGIREGGIKF